MTPDNQFEFRAQADWEFEFPDRTGHPNLPDRSCWTGLNPDLYSAYTSFIGSQHTSDVLKRVSTSPMIDFFLPQGLGQKLKKLSCAEQMALESPIPSPDMSASKKSASESR